VRLWVVARRLHDGLPVVAVSYGAGDVFFSHQGPYPNFITKKQRNYNVLMGKEYRTTYYKIAEIQNQGAAQIAQQLNIRNWQNDEKTTKQLKSTKNTVTD
jgi:hypothetical protein